MHIPSSSTFCFVGDSITAAEKFTRILVDYFVLHFPQRRIIFHNTAVPGLSADDTLANWDALITPYRPTHATVMFGMNDLQRALYADSAKITDALMQKREAAQTKFRENMDEVSLRLSGVQQLVMTPTPHDESPKIQGPLYSGYDDALATAASFVSGRFSPVLDLHTILSEINGRRLVPTIIGPDRVHPGNIGQALIAHFVLQALGVENPRLPLWDNTITEDELAVLKKLGVLVDDISPKNPYSDMRREASRRLILFNYVEWNVLWGQGVATQDTERADALLRAQMENPIEEWRKTCYIDYMENRNKKAEIQEKVKDAMEKMYSCL